MVPNLLQNIFLHDTQHLNKVMLRDLVINANCYTEKSMSISNFPIFAIFSSVNEHVAIM